MHVFTQISDLCNDDHRSKSIPLSVHWRYAEVLVFDYPLQQTKQNNIDGIFNHSEMSKETVYEFGKRTQKVITVNMLNQLFFTVVA